VSSSPRHAERAGSRSRPDEGPAQTGFIEELREQLARWEAAAGLQRHDGAPGGAPPAWRRPTPGEARWPVSVAMAAAIALQVALPNELTAASRFLLPAIEAAILVVLLAINPRRIDRVSRPRTSDDGPQSCDDRRRRWTHPLSLPAQPGARCGGTTRTPPTRVEVVGAAKMREDWVGAPGRSVSLLSCGVMRRLTGARLLARLTWLSRRFIIVVITPRRPSRDWRGFFIGGSRGE